MDIKLRNEYLEKYYASIGREFLKIDRLANAGGADVSTKTAKIYVTKSIYDKPLRQPYILSGYEQEIQVGAALTGERMGCGMLTDNIGDNISDRNRQFCELTALYWIWKNAREDIVGLAHYRRHFMLPGDWRERMLCSQVDVILPTPLYVAPSLEENYKSRHEALEWDYMMQCIKECGVQAHAEAKAFFEGNLYSPCNMFIARREVLDELCGWLFPILLKVAGHVGQKGDNYQNRYPGFLSERLLSFFIEKNRGKYKVAYADKDFLT